MRRILLGLALGILIAVPVGYAGAKVVSNPISADVDGGGYSITNLTGVGTGAVSTWKTVLVTQNYPNPSGGLMALFGGQDDPTLAGGPRDPYQGVQANQPIGSVYIEQAGATPGNVLSGTGVVWIKTGPAATDWRQLAYAP